MGITNNCIKFLGFAYKSGADFNQSLMLGRQRLYAKNTVIKEVLGKIDAPISSIQTSEYSEPLFEALGAKSVDSLDMSDFEGANITHDLNVPIPSVLKNKYTLIFDGGTLEHVFNFPVAFENCMKMLRIGGSFISVTPTNNLCGHGFYQFSPELYFSIYHNCKGFKLESLFIGVAVQGAGMKKWHEVKDPKEVRSRVTVRNSEETYLLVLGKKTDDFSMNESFPYQSDYDNAWEKFEGSVEESPTFIKKVYQLFIPKILRDKLYKARNRKGDLISLEGLGSVNPNFFSSKDPDDFLV